MENLNKEVDVLKIRLAFSWNKIMNLKKIAQDILKDLAKEEREFELTRSKLLVHETIEDANKFCNGLIQ